MPAHRPSTLPVALRAEPKRAVIVLPGFLACDLSTSVLRAFLRHRGHRATPWGFGRNLGPVDGLIEALIDRVRREAAGTGAPVSLVGHSLGGIFAREVAKAAPNAVHLVVTLGSPIRALTPDGEPTPSNAALLRLIERSVGKTVAEIRRDGRFCNLTAAPPVRCVSIFSRRDRVAHWESCLESPSRLTENVEVQSTHRRMVLSPSVFRVIAEKLECPSRRNRQSDHEAHNGATPVLA